MSWRTIKVRENTYKRLRGLGMGIDRAIRVLLASRARAIEEKLTEMREVGGDLVSAIMSAGLFRIRFKDFGIKRVLEDGNDLTLEGFITLTVPDPDLREKIKEAVR